MVRWSLWRWLLIIGVLAPSNAGATVTSTTRSVTYSPSTDTSTFAVTFRFDLAGDLTVTKITDATSAESTLVQNVDYTVRLGVGSTNGSITTTVAVTSDYSIRIDRDTALTQPRSFRRQGTYRADEHERAFDRLAMQVQEATLEAGTSGDAAVATHEGQADPHTQYALLAGRSGGQTLYGGTASGNNLTLHSTSNATKGSIFFGSGSAFDDVNDRLGIGTTSPSYNLDLSSGNMRVGSYWVMDSTGIWAANTAQVLEIGAGDTGSLGDTDGPPGLMLYGPDHATLARRLHLFADQYVWFDESGNSMGSLTDSTWTITSADLTVTAGDINVTAGSVNSATVYGDGGDIAVASGSGLTGTTTVGGTVTIDETNTTVGINDTSPDADLDVSGDAIFRRPLNRISDHLTVDEDDCNSVIIQSGDDKVITLPALSSTYDGCQLTVVRGSDAVKMYVSPNSADSIFGVCYDTSSGTDADIAFTGTDDLDAILGDLDGQIGHRITIVGDNTGGGWWVTECVGEWSSEVPP